MHPKILYHNQVQQLLIKINFRTIHQNQAQQNQTQHSSMKTSKHSSLPSDDTEKISCKTYSSENLDLDLSQETLLTEVRAFYR